MSGSQLPWDDGVANERTALAWQRTALSLVASGAVLAKASGSAIAAGVIFGVVALTAMLLVLHSDRRRHRRHSSRPWKEEVTAPVDLAVTTAIVVALAACGLIVIAT
jgi:putative membrane protein